MARPLETAKDYTPRPGRVTGTRAGAAVAGERAVRC